MSARIAEGRRRRRGVWLVMAVSLLAGPVDAAKEEAPEPRATMHEVFGAITQLFPLALDPEKYADPSNRAEITAMLDALASSVGRLNEHADERDAGFRNLSRSLGGDVEEARARFKLQRFEGSRYFVIESTRKCIACHSRVPSQRDFPLAGKLVDSIPSDQLEPGERAQLLVVTRSFKQALDTWEALFRDTSVSPASFDSTGYLLDYLTVAIRVVGDLDRASRTLGELLGRSDLPKYLRKHIDAWQESLDTARAEKISGSPLERARRLIEPTDGEIVRGQRLLVSDLIGSSLLLQYIDTGEPSDPQAAEAFYLLGLAEARTVEAFWAPQAEFHLEMAIRLDPQGPFAELAYSLLESQLELGYGGSSGVHLPTDVWVTLNELKALMESK